MGTIIKRTIDFIGLAKFALILSLFAIAYAVNVWFSIGDAKYGVDFKGGHELIYKFTKKLTSEDIRKSLAATDIENFVVQEFESDQSEFSIRLAGEQKDATTINAKVKDGFAKSDYEFTQLSTNFVGPTIGAELRKKALIAIVISLIGILLYIAYKFEFAYALGAVAALFHDVIICLGIYLISGRTLNMTTLAACLTIVGYSVNDTIIVFDRIREEFTKNHKMSLKEVFNFSINATLSRTIITSLLTLFSALALLIYGGGAIKDLSIFLTAGIISGTYSTIFIASPIALFWFRRSLNKKK